MKTHGLGPLGTAITEAWEIQPRRELVDWIRESIRLPKDISSRPGPVDLDGDFAFCREILAACDDPETQEVSFMASSQVTKTSIGYFAAVGLAVISPSPAMFVMPNRAAVREFRERVYMVCDASKEVSKLVPPERLRNDYWLSFGRSRTYLGNAEEKQTLSGKACRRVFCSEVDRYDKKQGSGQGDTMKLADQRVASFPGAGRLIFRESTPQIKGKSRIAREYFERSDRRKYHVPCPHCGHYQELRFFPHKEGPHAGRGGIHGLRDEAGNWQTPEAAKAEAWYQCENCESPISDEARGQMIRRGVWCPAGSHVDANGQLQGEPLRDGTHKGFHLSRLYAPAENFSWGAIAAEYVQSRENPALLQIFWNDWLGLPFEHAGKAPEWQGLRRLEVDVPRGHVHPEAVFLTCGVDKQADHVYWCVRAWGSRRGMATSWQVDYGRLFADRDATGEPLPGSDLAKLDPEVFERDWPVWGGGGARRVSLCLADAGYAPLRFEVYEFARARPKLVRAIKGETKIAANWQMTEIERSGADGSKVQTYALWLVNVDRFKAILRRSWLIPTDQPGAWCLTRGVEELYLRQLSNEVEVVEVARDGRPRVRWVARPDGYGWDYWDCEVYAQIAAEMWTGGRWRDLKEFLAAIGSGKPDPSPASPQSPASRPFVRRPPSGWLDRRS